MPKMNSPRRICLILGDQLTPSISSLDKFDKDRDVVLMAEVLTECTYVPHHPKKIAFILSAMRHFRDELSELGFTIDYVTLDDPDNTGSMAGEVFRAVRNNKAELVCVTEPGEWRLLDEMSRWSNLLSVDVDIRPDNRFIFDRVEFSGWATARKRLRMEDFYREVRRQTGLLIDEDGAPMGGRWNFDKDNRKTLPKDICPPLPYRVRPDDITRNVLDLVSTRFSNHFGSLENYWFGATRADAQSALEKFITEALPSFGDYQDAMKVGEPTLFHSVTSLYLNVGLLDPMDVCRAAERAYISGDAALNAVEGFIRQIIGWREYVRGLYWHFMPEYGRTNALEAHRPLPSFYWDGETEMACMRACIEQTRDEAYAHHIQRLMVTGNFALLAGINPQQVQEWYLAVYADAFEWVELPNTQGMALFADDGVIATKPYAAGGRYINKMSNYCASCRYDPTDAVGEDACPFSYLYWDFVIRNRDRLQNNHRMRTVYSSLNRMDPERVKLMKQNAAEFLGDL